MQTIEKNWGEEKGREPDMREGDKLIFSEPGRVLFNTCYRSFYHCLVKRDMGTVLLTKHGGGQEEYRDYLLDRIIPALEILNSDQRYMFLHQIFDAYRDGKREGAEITSGKYRVAFVEGRLKKRKVRKGTSYKVWIENKWQVEQKLPAKI